MKKKLYFWPELIINGIFSGRRVFVKLNFIETLIINYYSFSWSDLNTNQKINAIGIIMGSIISIALAIIGWVVFS